MPAWADGHLLIRINGGKTASNKGSQHGPATLGIVAVPHRSGNQPVYFRPSISRIVKNCINSYVFDTTDTFFFKDIDDPVDNLLFLR
jgi:hypothetical protein